MKWVNKFWKFLENFWINETSPGVNLNVNEYYRSITQEMLTLQTSPRVEFIWFSVAWNIWKDYGNSFIFVTKIQNLVVVWTVKWFISLSLMFRWSKRNMCLILVFDSKINIILKQIKPFQWLLPIKNIKLSHFHGIAFDWK